MRAKVPKCHCLAIGVSSSKVVDQQLVVDSQPIPLIETINFLGMKIEVPGDAMQELRARLKYLFMDVL